MRGHEELIAMRLRGYAPRMVWIDAELNRLPMADDWHNESPAAAHLQLAPTENPATVDFRCVVGLDVWISGDDAKRVRGIRDACIAAQARRVVASTHEQIGADEWVSFRLVERTDTAGQLTIEKEAAHG